MKLWSGPSRAYQAHLDILRSRQHDMDRCKTNITSIHALPGSLIFWAGFARSFGNAMTDGATLAAQEDLGRDLFSSDNMQIATLMMSNELTMLDEAVTHYVSHHIVELVTAIAEQSEPEMIFPTDIPTPTGLAVLEHPFLLNDLHPETGAVDLNLHIPIRAIGWFSGQMARRNTSKTENPELINGVTLILYTDSDSYNSTYVPALERQGITGQRATESTLIPIEYHPWGFGSWWQDGGNDFTSIEPGSIVSSIAYVRRWFLSFMRLMWQQILSPEYVAPDRGLRRKAERMKWSRAHADIKVLKLRRIYRDDERDDGTGSWTMTHQSITRGHWRNQYYPSLGPVGDPASYRRIWIAPFVRGPEDAPLVVKRDITALVR